MSAFMMSSETIASLAKLIMGIPHKYGMAKVRPGSPECRKLFHMDWSVGAKPSQFKTWEELADAMTLMNVEALKQRYLQNDPEYFWESVTEVDLEAAPKKMVPVQFLKSLQCFTYQCAEGDVPDSDLFKALEGFESVLPNAILRGTKAYEKAVWG